MQDASGLCVINIGPTWQSHKTGRSVESQTMAKMTIESGMQTQAGSAGKKDPYAAPSSSKDADGGEHGHRLSVAIGTDDRIGSGDNGFITARPDGSQFVYQIKNYPGGGHYDEGELAKFLSANYKGLLADLKSITKSSAFDGYEPGWKDKSSVGARLLSTFPSVIYLQGTLSQAASAASAGASSKPHHQAVPLQVTGVSWNAAGALVGASYGRVDSYTWSTSNGFIAVWPAAGHYQSRKPQQQEDGADKDKNAASAAAAVSATAASSETKPLALLETDAFATCVAFHPTVSTLLAAGTFSGEVILYDISATDDQSGTSARLLFSNFGTTQGANYGDSHYSGGGSKAGGAGGGGGAGAAGGGSGSVTAKDPINKLVWIEDSTRVESRESHRYLLCAASSDGSVAFWSVLNRFSDPVALGLLQNRRHGPLGVLSVAFASAGGQRRVPKSDAAMVLATDSGDVVRGKVPPYVAAKAAAAAATSASASAAQPQRVAGMNDTDFAGEGHKHSGPANAIDTSPFFRNVFLSCSSDGSVRVFSLLDMQHKLALVPSPDTKHFLYGAAFSPVRPGVIATCSRNSQVHLYDLAQSRVEPAFTVKKAGTEDSAVLCLGWSAQGSYFATGDARGCVRVWNVAAALCETTEVERLAIRQAATSGGGGGGLTDSPGKLQAKKEANDPLSHSALETGRFATEASSAGTNTDPLQLLYGFAA